MGILGQGRTLGAWSGDTPPPDSDSGENGLLELKIGVFERKNEVYEQKRL